MFCGNIFTSTDLKNHKKNHMKKSPKRFHRVNRASFLSLSNEFEDQKLIPKISPKKVLSAPCFSKIVCGGQCTIYYWWRNVCVHCKTPEAVLTHPSIHMKTTFADVEPNPAIVCVVGPAAVVTFPFNSRQAAVGGAVLAPGGGFLARAPCPSYNPNPNTSIEFPLGVSLAWYFVHCKLS